MGSTNLKISNSPLIKVKNTHLNSLTGCAALFLAIAPVLDPYIMISIGSGFTLKITDVLVLMLGACAFARSPHLDKDTSFLCYLLGGLWIISLFGNIHNHTSIAMSSKNIIIWMVYVILISYIWKIDCRREFLIWLQRIAFAASILIFLQFLGGNLGIRVWNGRLSFLNIGKYEGWAGYIDLNTGDIRPNSFFQEASYAGIYLSIAYAQAIKEGKMVKALMFMAAMCLTTSLVAISTCGFISIYYWLVPGDTDLSQKTIKKIIVILAVLMVGIIIFGVGNSAFHDTISYVIRRFKNLRNDLTGTRMSSAKYRILGHIDQLQYMTWFQKIFGLGIGQYSAYFNIPSYSNVFVTTILNSGLLGLTLLIVSLVRIGSKIPRYNRVYYYVLLIVMSVDYLWFNWYFFYILSAAVLKDEKLRVNGN